jgi:hypothetical protein
MNKLRACLAMSNALLLSALCGFFPVPPAYAQRDPARAVPPPGTALVFVVRSERERVAAEVPVAVNAQAVGQLADGAYLVVTVAAGRTFVRAGDRVLSAVSLQTEPNRSYFVSLEAVSGVKPVRTDMRLVSESEGRRLVAQSRLVQTAPGVIAAPRPTPPAPAAPPRVDKPAAPPPAKPAPPPRVVRPAPPLAVAREPAVPAADWKTALVFKTGSFKMAQGDQVVGRLASNYDTASSPVLGMELEWRNRTGLAVGGEVFYYKNELIATGLVAEQTVVATLLNGKYYFRAANSFYPFVGAGIGFASATYGGNLTGRASGLAYQGLAGVEFRFNNVGLHAQFKYLAATTDDGTGEKVKVGGSGVLAGASIAF